MQYFSCEHPGEGLQAGVWVWANLHASLVSREGDGAGMIKKTPWPNCALFFGRQRPCHGYATHVGHPRLYAFGLAGFTIARVFGICSGLTAHEDSFLRKVFT